MNSLTIKYKACLSKRAKLLRRPTKRHGHAGNDMVILGNRTMLEMIRMTVVELPATKKNLNQSMRFQGVP